MAVVEKKSFCRICGSSCGIVVAVDGDTVVRVRGDEDHPFTRGYTCPKGRALPQQHHQADRLEVPMMRDKAGVLQPAAWDDVLDDLGGKLAGLLRDHGPRAIGAFAGGGGYLDASGNYSSIRFAQAIATPSCYGDMTIDNIAKMYVPEVMSGMTALMGRTDPDRCKLIVYMGTNPVISHGHTATLWSPTAAIRTARERGAEVWAIDPRRTETAQRANRYIGPRPGTDYAILGFLVREVLREGAARAFIADHTQGVDALRDAVERFSLEYVSALCDVQASDLTDLLAAVRRAGRLSVETGTGVTMSLNANVTQWLSWALMLVTDSLDREGGTWIHPGIFSRRDKQDGPPAPEDGWKLPGPASRPELYTIAGQYPCAAMPDEIAAGHLRAMMVFGANIEPSLPERARSYEALKQLDVLATFDVRPTRTTDISTHVLPTKDQLERADITHVTEFYFPVLAAQYTPAMIEPVGQRKSHWWIVNELGKRMGVDFFPGFTHQGESDDAFLEYVVSQSEVSFADLQRDRLISAPPVIGWVHSYVDEKIGGWRLAPSPLVAQIEKLAEQETMAPTGVVLIPRRQKYHENSKLLELRDNPHVFVSPVDAEEAGLEDGGTVRVTSENGTLVGVVKIDATLRRGAINIPHGWSDEHNVNRLTGTRRVDPLTGMVQYSGLPVSLCPA
jgi:anaerobic selenocysteine-containing dehydrogenase